jgi:hypothetical protein
MASSINALTAAGGGIAMGADASGILQLQSAGTATVTVGTAGGVGIGTTTTTNAKLTVNANTVLPATAPLAGTNLWITGADATSSRIFIDSFGNASALNFRTSGGTAAAPTAILANALIGVTVGMGYGATAYSAARSAMSHHAAENWTDAAQGSYQAFSTTAIGSTTQTERMRIDDVGNVTLQKNISVGGAAPTTSGSGITFPATQSDSSDANTLDDYEEGTWTPTFQFGTAGNLTIVYSSQVGKYTKIGRTVHVEMTMATTTFTHTTASGNASISGLPFTIGGTDATTLTGACGGYVNATYPILGMQFFPTVATIFLVRGGLGAGAAATFLDFPSAGNLYITFQATYIV